MRPMLLLLVLPLLLGAGRVIEGLPLADPAPSGQSGLQARLVFSSNHLGEFEPCACKDLPLGGLAQQVGVIEDLRAESAVPLFAFDAGDRLFRFDVAAISQEEAARRLKAILQVDAGNVAGLDAAGVGSLDLGGGLPYLRKLAQRARYPMVSANLLDADGAAVFPASVVVERGGLRVGVTSVLPGGLATREWQTADPIKTARAEVAALREKGVDLVVVLSNLGLADDKKLARATKADAVLGSRSREILAEGPQVGRTVLSQAGSRGRYVGEVRWYADGKGRGPHLLATTIPVLAAGPVSGPVHALVQRTLGRLADPRLGVEPIRPDDPRHPAYEPGPTIRP